MNNLGPVWFRSNSIFSFQFSVFSSHNSNPKLITQFSNSTFIQKLQNNVWTQFSVTYFYHFSPNLWALPLTLPSVVSVATRVSLMKNPLLPLLLLYFSKLKESPCSTSHLSPLTSHIDARRHQSKYFL